MNLKPLFHIEEKPKLKGRYEERIYSAISQGNLFNFYLDHFTVNARNINEKGKLKEARNYLIKSGLLISILDTHVDAQTYSIIKLPEPCGKIINISLFGFKNSYDNYIKSGKASYPIVQYHEFWKENYNRWLAIYFDNIKNGL